MVRLELVEKKAHAAMATCATWAPTNVLYSCSDDQTILKWDQQAEVTGKCCELDAYVTSIAWMPSVGRGVSDVFAVSACDGSFRLVTGSGREEKRVAAHHGACLRVLEGNSKPVVRLFATDDCAQVRVRRGTPGYAVGHAKRGFQVSAASYLGGGSRAASRAWRTTGVNWHSLPGPRAWLLVAFLSFFLSSRPSPLRVINVIICYTVFLLLAFRIANSD